MEQIESVLVLVTILAVSASVNAKQLSKEEADFYCSEASQATEVVLYEFAREKRDLS